LGRVDIWMAGIRRPVHRPHGRIPSGPLQRPTRSRPGRGGLMGPGAGDPP
jgi:hypothetical protein